MEALAILKQKALKERANTIKGRKDLIDLVSLFKLPDFDWNKYKKTVLRYGLSEQSKFTKDTIRQTAQLEELGLNVHKMAKLKKKVLPLI